MATPTTLKVNNRSFDATVPRTLELHADYACENSGHCCREGWGIALQGAEAERFTRAMRSQGVAEETIAQHCMPAPSPENPDRCRMGCDTEGHCLFAGEEDGQSFCRFQRTCGHEALPAVCQSFPRLAVATPSGVYLTLSYTCPTAVKLLTRPNALREVAPRKMFKSRPELQGASFSGDAKPPRFSINGQPDWAAFDYFWRWAPEWIATPALSPAHALYGLGLIIDHIESLGAEASTLVPLMNQLDQAAAALPAALEEQAKSMQPITELGVVYFDSLLKIMRQVAHIPAELQELWEGMTQGRAGLERAQVMAAYDRLIRPKVPEYDLIERNFIASRLYANQLAYRSRWLRTGYFVNVLSLVTLRFAALAICLREDIAPSEEVWLRAATIVDRLLQHHADLQVKFLNLLERNIQGPITDLALPAVF